MHIELLQPHTHQGQAYAAGDLLDLPEPSARWLIAEGIARVTAITRKPPQDTTTRTGHDPNPTSGD